jgi:hypothetical protein
VALAAVLLSAATLRAGTIDVFLYTTGDVSFPRLNSERRSPASLIQRVRADFLEALLPTAPPP